MAHERAAPTFDLPARLVAGLEEVQRLRGKGSLAQGAQDAILWYLGVRSAAASHDLQRLTRRQLEVLTLAAHGRSTKEIAEHLGISVKTVETYRTQLMNTFHFKGIADVVRFAIRAGVMPPYV